MTLKQSPEIDFYKIKTTAVWFLMFVRYDQQRFIKNTNIKQKCASSSKREELVEFGIGTEGGGPGGHWPPRLV